MPRTILKYLCISRLAAGRKRKKISQGKPSVFLRVIDGQYREKILCLITPLAGSDIS